jgi:hypothetical protein
VFLYSASDLTDIGDISAFQPYEIQLTKAPCLTVLTIGSDKAGYTNGRLSALDLSACILLTKLNVIGCTALTGTLDLSSNGLIEEVYAENSGLAYVKLPNGGVLKALYLPAVTNITVQNQNGLTEFSCESYENLNTLRVENTPGIPTLEIVQSYLENLTGGLRLTGIDWDLGSDTTVLELLVSSAAQGKYLSNTGILSESKTAYPYISGTIKITALGTALLAQLKELYPYLTISYTTTIPQYTIKFVNYDGTVLNAQYVLSGSAATDPVKAGLIDEPTREKSASTVYTYSGWNKSFSGVSGNMTVTAQYTETAREYTVTWKNIDGSVLDTQTTTYGAEVVYSGDTPAYTVYESVYAYYLFSGWDKCTGCITEDMVVTAQYDGHIQGLPDDDTEISEMSATQIYGLRQAGRIKEFAAIKDRMPITLGYLPDYTNVRSEVLGKDVILDGQTCIDTGVQLLKEDSTWVLVVDGTFATTTDGQVMVGCMDEESYNGLQCRYNSGLSVRWGVNSLAPKRTTLRELIVVRHLAGERSVTMYAATPENTAITTASIAKSTNNFTSATLTLGANKNEDGTITNYATGTLHMCKLYYGDIGDAECRNIAVWPGKTYDIEVCYTGGAYKDAEGNATSLDFLFASALTLTKQMNSVGDNTGGWETTPLREWLLSRFYKALPIQWRQIIKPITVIQTAGSKDGTASAEIQSCVDTVTLPNYVEVTGTTNEPWVYCGKQIPYLINDQSRICFRGCTIPDGATFYRQSTDPTEAAGNTVKEGDVWINTSTGQPYIRVGNSWVASSSWWLRDASVSTTAAFAVVYSSGFAYSNGANATYRFGVRPRFSI